MRVTLSYPPDRTESTELQRLATAGRTVRVVLAVTGSPTTPPLDQPSRDAYCGYIAGVLRRYPLVLAGWQSGLLRPDWSAKPGFAAYQEAIAAAAAGTIDCGQAHR